MATLVFDIETAAVEDHRLHPEQLRFIYRELETCTDAHERETRREEIDKMRSLWALTAEVVCIAMVNADTQRGQVLYVAPDYEEVEEGPQGIEFIVCMDEAELLHAFWDVAKHYERVVTFNGRSFDVPFLYLRSAILNVPITRKDWLSYRYSSEPHCDLAEQLCFFGISGRDGAARRFNLDFYCRAFGIPSPKEEGIDGQSVTELIRQGRYREVAEYCLRDVLATAQLYKIWRERLAGISDSMGRR